MSKEKITFYQNGHFSLLNPSAARRGGWSSGATLEELLSLITSANEADRKMREATSARPRDWYLPSRLPRESWAFTERAGIIGPLTSDGVNVSFHNSTAATNAILQSNRDMNVQTASEPKAFEMFFEAFGKQILPSGQMNGVQGSEFVSGVLHHGEIVAFGRPVTVWKAAVGSSVLLLRHGGELRLRKFNYDSAEGQSEKTAESLSLLGSIYAAIGWNRQKTLDEVVMPVLEAFSSSASSHGFNAISGTVLIPKEAMDVCTDSSRRLCRPIHINLSYDPKQDGSDEDFQYYCCTLNSIDPLRFLESGEYALLICEVVEGLSEGKALADAEDIDMEGMEARLREGYLAGDAGDGGAADLEEADRPGEDLEEDAEIASAIASGQEFDALWDFVNYFSPQYADLLVKMLGEKREYTEAKLARVHRIATLTRKFILARMANRILEKGYPDGNSAKDGAPG
jgi:hypothetical protein